MRSIVVAVAAALALTGCATGGSEHWSPKLYADYPSMLQDSVWQTLQTGKGSSAPEAVKQAYAECSAKLAWTALPLDQQIKLNEWAQQKRPMSTAELNEADQTIRQEWAPLTFDKMRPFCADDVAKFKAAFGGEAPVALGTAQ